VAGKFAALVEKCGVIFVGFDNKSPACPQTGRYAKIHRYAADQKSGLQTGAFQYPGDHGGGGRFAMGARDGDDMPTLQDVLGQPLGAAGVGQACVQNGFHQREFGSAIDQVDAADHVAHHIHVGGKCQLVGAEAFHQVNAKCSQLIAHGGVNASVTAGDFVACFPCQSGQATHESATNTKNMNMHG
jgi:hypothetical protein